MVLVRVHKVLDVLLVHHGIVYLIGGNHTFSLDFNIDKSIIIDDVIKVVEINYFLWYYVVRHSRAFEIFDF